MNHKELMSEFSFRSGNFPAINVSPIGFQTEKLSKQQERQLSYKNKIWGHLRQQCCCEQAIIITYADCVVVALGTQHSVRVQRFTWAIPKSTSDWLVKKIQNREHNFIIWNSYIHNCITSPHSCHPHLGTCRTLILVFVVPRHRTVPPSYAASTYCCFGTDTHRAQTLW
jgi:hypothetical protein